MTPRESRPLRRVVVGDALRALSGLPAGFAQTCITSPPYWNLRDYGVEPQVWGGEEGCSHEWRDAASAFLRGGEFCDRCGAWFGCLGLEPDPNLYVEHLVQVLAAVRRALRDDGTLWLNLGDTFASNQPPAGFKPKDMIGIPWRVGLALQSDGWWLRSDNIWQKPNAMPESVQDRPTRAHEYVLLLAKSQRYFYDAEAVREPERSSHRSGNDYRRPPRLTYRDPDGPRGGDDDWLPGAGRNRRSVWTIPTQAFSGAHFATFPERLVEPCVLAGSSPTACGICRAPWRRIVSTERLIGGDQIRGAWTAEGDRLVSGRAMNRRHSHIATRRETLGWEPTCDHEDGNGRCIVLDPFAGTGTAGLVSARLGRDFVGVELSRRFGALARGRLEVAETERAAA